MPARKLVEIVSAVLICFVLCAAHPASAQGLDEATALNQQAIQLYNQGRFSEAIPLAQRVLAIREKALNPDHLDVAVSLHNLAGLYYAQGRYTDAEPLYKRSLAILEKAFGPYHLDIAASLNNLAVLYRDQGRYADAEPLYNDRWRLERKPSALIIPMSHGR